jgi:hypothetical protein
MGVLNDLLLMVFTALSLCALVTGQEPVEAMSAPPSQRRKSRGNQGIPAPFGVPPYFLISLVHIFGRLMGRTSGYWFPRS